MRKTFVFNALTWLDEVRDPEALELDVRSLHAVAAPALLTLGDQSAPFFPLVVGLLAAALQKAKTWTYPGADHVPHVTHPKEYVRVVEEFIGRLAT